MKKLSERARRFSTPYRVTKGKGFRLRDVDPADTAQLESSDEDRPRARRCRRASSSSPSTRTCSTRRIAGRCC